MFLFLNSTLWVIECSGGTSFLWDTTLGGAKDFPYGKGTALKWTIWLKYSIPRGHHQQSKWYSIRITLPVPIAVPIALPHTAANPWNRHMLKSISTPTRTEHHHGMRWRMPPAMTSTVTRWTSLHILSKTFIIMNCTKLGLLVRHYVWREPSRDGWKSYLRPDGGNINSRTQLGRLRKCHWSYSNAWVWEQSMWRLFSIKWHRTPMGRNGRRVNRSLGRLPAGLDSLKLPTDPSLSKLFPKEMEVIMVAWNKRLSGISLWMGYDLGIECGNRFWSFMQCVTELLLSMKALS